MLALALALSGCAELGASWKGLRPVRPAVVEQRSIEDAGAGTPQRTVVPWFQHLQHADVTTAVRFYDPALRVTVAELRRQRASTGKFFGTVGLARILDVSRAGGRATVFTMLGTRFASPNGRAWDYRKPQAFTLRRVAGAWRLADDLFLESARGLAPAARVDPKTVTCCAAPPVLGWRPVRTSGSPPAALVRPQSLARYPAGGPARAALALVRAIEFNDPSASAALIAPAARLTPRRLARLLPIYSLLFQLWGASRVRGVRRRAADAAVVTRGAGSLTLTFELTSVNGAWRLSGLRLGHARIPLRGL